MLWWQDGYDQFEKADLCRYYHQAAAEAAAFVHDVDYTGFRPIPCVFAERVKGDVIGSDHVCLGWFRDVGCAPPDWQMKSLSGQDVTVNASGTAWRVEFIDTLTGKATGESRLAVHDRRIRILLPEFQGAIAVRLTRLEP